jgi:hypothetical protein
VADHHALRRARALAEALDWQGIGDRFVDIVRSTLAR